MFKIVTVIKLRSLLKFGNREKSGNQNGMSRIDTMFGDRVEAEITNPWRQVHVNSTAKPLHLLHKLSGLLSFLSGCRRLRFWFRLRR